MAHISSYKDLRVYKASSIEEDSNTSVKTAATLFGKFIFAVWSCHYSRNRRR